MNKDVSKIITGMTFFRYAHQASQMIPGDNRKVFMIAGLLAVPKDMPIMSEHQIVVVGTDGPSLKMAIDRPIDVRKFTEYASIDGVLQAPIWRF